MDGIAYVLLQGSPTKSVGWGMMGAWGSVLLTTNPSSELQGLQVDNRTKGNSIIIPILYQSRRSKVQQSPIYNTLQYCTGQGSHFVHLWIISYQGARNWDFCPRDFSRSRAAAILSSGRCGELASAVRHKLRGIETTNSDWEKSRCASSLSNMWQQHGQLVDIQLFRGTFEGINYMYIYILYVHIMCMFVVLTCTNIDITQ